MKNSRLLKWVLRFIVISIILIYILNKYVLDEPKISEKIKAFYPVSVSLNESIRVKAYSTSAYFNYLNNGEFKKAYNMLSKEYKDYVSYDDYLKSLEQYDYTHLIAKTVKQLNDNTYVVTMIDKDTEEEHLFTVYESRLYENSFSISPDKFICHVEPNEKKSADSIEAILKSYDVYQDHIDIYLTLKNKTSEELVIDDVRVELTLAGRLSNKLEKIKLEPKEKRDVTVSYVETSYYIPKEILIETAKTTLKFNLQ